MATTVPRPGRPSAVTRRAAAVTGGLALGIAVSALAGCAHRLAGAGRAERPRRGGALGVPLIPVRGRPAVGADGRAAAARRTGAPRRPVARRTRRPPPATGASAGAGLGGCRGGRLGAGRARADRADLRRRRRPAADRAGLRRRAARVRPRPGPGPAARAERARRPPRSPCWRPARTPCARPGCWRCWRWLTLVPRIARRARRRQHRPRDRRHRARPAPARRQRSGSAGWPALLLLAGGL